VKFIAIFNISRRNFNDGLNLSLPRQLTITLKVPGAKYLRFELKQFFWGGSFFVLFFCWLTRQKRTRTTEQKNERSQGRSLTRRRRERGRGRLTRRKQQSQAIIRDPFPFIRPLFDHYPIYQTNIGPRYSLCTSPSAEVNDRFNSSLLNWSNVIYFNNSRPNLFLYHF
jgi:hypothetical protein